MRGTSTATERPQAPDDLVLIEEAARLAGVTTKTVYGWCHEGLVKSHRPIARGRGRRYVDRASLMGFLRGEQVGA